MTEDPTTSGSPAAGHDVAPSIDAAIDARAHRGAQETQAHLIVRLEAQIKRLETAVNLEREEHREAVSGVARIELAQRQSHDVLLGQIGQLGQRLDRMEAALAVADSKDALARIELAQHQSHDVLLGQIGQLGQRLDRMEATLAAADGKDALARIESALGADREERGALARKVEESLAALHAKVQGRGSEAPSAALLRIERLGEALVPPAFASIKAALSPDEPAWVYVRDDREAPSALAAVRSALPAFVDLRAHLAPGCPLIWLLPPPQAEEADEAELIHALGVLASDPRVIADPGSHAATIVVGKRRTELLVRIVRWDGEQLHACARAPTNAALAATTPAVVLEAEASEESSQAWAERTAYSLHAVYRADCRPERRSCGIVWPRASLVDIGRYASAAKRLQARLENAGFQVAFQWVEGPPRVADAQVIRQLAQILRIRLDLTPTVRQQNAEAFAAYEDLVPYAPADFDLRIPGIVPADADQAPLVCMARQDAALTMVSADPFSALAARRAERLRAVLDREQRKRLRAAVSAGRPEAGSWEQRIVYNWKPPENAWIRVLVLDPDAPLTFTPREGLVAARIDALLTQLDEVLASYSCSTPQYRALQMAAHTYLPGKQSPAADALRLATWFPPHLGATLEIGCGFGVFAQTFLERTSGYVGIDLTVRQAQAIAALGGVGIVADMQHLPFANAAFDTVIADNAIEHTLNPVGTLREVRRVLKPAGRAFFVIPLDYLGLDYRNESHLWKADERSIRAACATAGLLVVRQETCVLPEIGATGSFPSCNQRTSLWELRPAAGTAAADGYPARLHVATEPRTAPFE